MTEKTANVCAILTCVVVIALLVGGIVVVSLYFSQIKRVYDTVQTVEDYVYKLKEERTIDNIMHLTHVAANGVQVIEDKLDQLIPKTNSVTAQMPPQMRLEGASGHGGHGQGHGRFNSVASSYW
jgi:predicted PurR-regulated permease PerM